MRNKKALLLIFSAVILVSFIFMVNAAHFVDFKTPAINILPATGPIGILKNFYLRILPASSMPKMFMQLLKRLRNINISNCFIYKGNIMTEIISDIETLINLRLKNIERSIQDLEIFILWSSV